MHILEEVNNNVKLLNEMLVHYNKEDSSEADKELMKVGKKFFNVKCLVFFFAFLAMAQLFHCSLFKKWDSTSMFQCRIRAQLEDLCHGLCAVHSLDKVPALSPTLELIELSKASHFGMCFPSALGSRHAVRVLEAEGKVATCSVPF